jgi:hypothetical protein
MLVIIKKKPPKLFEVLENASQMMWRQALHERGKNALGSNRLLRSQDFLLLVPLNTERGDGLGVPISLRLSPECGTRPLTPIALNGFGVPLT